MLERLAVGATRLNLLALAWNLGVLAVALYQFGGYAVWRIRVRRTAQPVDTSWRSALPQGVPAHGRHAVGTQPHGGGPLHPVLLTPTGTAPNGADYMLAHELTHIKRHDVAKSCCLRWRVPCIGITLLSGCWPPARAATLRRPVTPRPCGPRCRLPRGLRRRPADRRAQNRGPALTSGFALNKRQFKQRLATLWDTAPLHRGRALLAVLALTACCAGGLVACKPADAAPQDEQEPAAAAALEPSGTANPIVTPEPPPVSMEAGAAS